MIAWDEIRNDILVGCCPRNPRDIRTIKEEALATAILSLQQDENLSDLGIDYQQLVDRCRHLGLVISRCPMRDFDHDDQGEALLEAIRTLHQLVEGGHRVYVHCTAGANRSPLTVLGYLVLIEGLDQDEALTLITTARPGAQPQVEWLRGARSQLADRYDAEICQRACYLRQQQANDNSLPGWLQAEQTVLREVLTGQR